MRFLVVMDPLDKLNQETDSTVAIIREAIKKSVEISICDTKDLFFLRNAVFAHCMDSSIQENNQRIRILKNETKKLDFFDLILMRKEPPYDLQYHFATMLLEKTARPVINSPQGLRNANEKLAILNFPSIIPKTIVTQNTNSILSFLGEHKKCVIKPLDLYGGKDVKIIENGKKNAITQIKKITQNGKKYAMVQPFMPEVMQGDKRIFLLNGKPIGAFTRVPKQGDFRANLAVGGTAKRTNLTKSDLHIIKTIQPYLKREGLAIVGIDIIKDKLIEINVTCPTGLVPLQILYGTNPAAEIADFLVAKAYKK